MIPGVFHLTRVNNTGAAFGILRGYSGVLVSVAFGCVVFLGIYLFRKFFLKKEISSLVALALLFVAAGALGNLYDRVFYGYVVDFIDFRIWPVFNIADTSISVGLLLLAIHYASHSI